MSFSSLEAVQVGSEWWCEGKIRNRRGETGWPSLYEGRLDKARMDGVHILPVPRNPAASLVVMHPWLMLRSFS